MAVDSNVPANSWVMRTENSSPTRWSFTMVSAAEPPNSRDTAATSSVNNKHFNTQQNQESSYASIRQTMDSMTVNGSAI